MTHQLTIERFVSDGDTTLGTLFIDGAFFCFTVEDEHRAEKLYGETRIPAGEYRVIERQHGGFYERYKAKFLHRRVFEIAEVPGFTDILFHIGNTDDHTAGCILLNADIHTAHGLKGSQSSLVYRRFYKRLSALLEDKQSITLRIVDRDGRH